MWNSKPLLKKDATNLKRLSQTAFNNHGALLTFSKQLKLWNKGKLKKTDLIIVDSKLIVSVVDFINKLPLVIRQSVLKKVTIDKHKIETRYFTDIVKLISASPLIIESNHKLNSFLVVLDRKSKANKELVCVLEINKINLKIK